MHASNQKQEINRKIKLQWHKFLKISICHGNGNNMRTHFTCVVINAIRFTLIMSPFCMDTQYGLDLLLLDLATIHNEVA